MSPIKLSKNENNGKHSPSIYTRPSRHFPRNAVIKNGFPRPKPRPGHEKNFLDFLGRGSTPAYLSI